MGTTTIAMEQYQADPLKTALYEKHRALKAKFVEFNGWQMPIRYEGTVSEHNAVREHVGIFDISHMGRVSIKGKEAEKFLDYLSANKIQAMATSSAIYTVWCDENGGCVDDLLVYREDDEEFFVIVNAGNRSKDFNHLKHYAKDFQVTIESHYLTESILAIQGPFAKELIAQIFPESSLIVNMHFAKIPYKNEKIILSATGYTGSGGFEICVPSKYVEEIWDLILEKGAHWNIKPIGLGARDTLRLEMGFSLYGHEISDTIAPTESVAAWSVKLNKPSFVGKEALLALESNPKKRSEYPIELLDQGIMRENADVFKDGKKIGITTSGGFSPTLKKSIGIVLTDKLLQEGDIVQVLIRSVACNAKVVSIPFIKAKTKS